MTDVRNYRVVITRGASKSMPLELGSLDIEHEWDEIKA